MNLLQAGLGFAFIAVGVLAITKRRAFSAFSDEQQRSERHARSLLNRERIEREDALYVSDAGRAVSAAGAALLGAGSVAAGILLIVRGLSG